MSSPTVEKLIAYDRARSEFLGGIGKSLFYELLAAGELETVAIGRRKFVIESSLVAYIERQRVAV